MTDKPELKPCPFCGTSGTMVMEDNRGVGCYLCPTPMIHSTIWNRRAPRFTPEELEAMRYFVGDPAEYSMTSDDAYAILMKMIEEDSNGR